MHDTGEWRASSERKGNTELFSLWAGDRRMSFAAMLQHLLGDEDFADRFSAWLAASPLDAFFWELPPLTAGNVENDAEFVLIDAPPLIGLRPNAYPFRTYFLDDEVVTFHSLGGDALLVAPSPIDATTNYAHLAAFLRTSSVQQRRALWRCVARSVQQSLGTAQLWLSTSGLGVSWLHIRLDETPKYYQHRPYARRRD